MDGQRSPVEALLIERVAVCWIDVYDIRNPERPVWVDSLETREPTGRFRPNYFRPIYADGDFLYELFQSGSLEAVAR